jgi:3-hydroxyacyl-CoA dehydrogenase
VEVISAGDSGASIIRLVVAALAKTGKQALVIKKPVEGFLVNRLQHAILHEAYHLIDQGVVSVEDVDKVAKQLLGPRMCITGLIKQKDISGLDTHALAQQAIVPHLWHGAEPVRLLQDMYQKGVLGLKTGRGFYDWTGQDPAEVRKGPPNGSAACSPFSKRRKRRPPRSRRRRGAKDRNRSAGYRWAKQIARIVFPPRAGGLSWWRRCPPGRQGPVAASLHRELVGVHVAEGVTGEISKQEALVIRRACPGSG